MIISSTGTNTKIEKDTRSSIMRPTSIVPKAHLLSLPETCSKSTSFTSSSPINTDSSNKLLQPVHPRNRLDENLDTISNASTSYYSIGESFITLSRNNSLNDFNTKETNSQRTSSQLSGHCPSINEHLNNPNLSLPLKQSQRLSKTGLRINTLKLKQGDELCN
ncbi:8317_t:CDS:1 [Racocetra fulgida]|uniref:8317_t:CDS:1 n=1 Tax=Racocetra fulgida TaxID=60492 RepID=A0A9N8ZVQ8_9GLOM|nr:8317_t:CDS:1 [Racocetra fulgida]